MLARGVDPCDYSFRIATEDDIPRLVEIDRKSFTVPWPEEAFYNDITNNRFAIYLLMEFGKDIAGYCGMWLVLDEAHVTNVAILPEYRGRKLGGALMEKMMLLAKDSGAKTMTLEVRVGNEVAKSLYKKMGFQEGGIRKNYYTDNQEDALAMWVNL